MITARSYRHPDGAETIDTTDKTIEAVEKDLQRILKGMDLLGGESEPHYSNWRDRADPWGKTRLFPQSYRWISCYAVTGGSEGHWVHVDVIGGSDEDPDRRELIFLAKTFMGWEHACKIAQACATILQA